MIAPLELSESKKGVVDDLKRMADALEPFGDRGIGDFAAFLARADEFDRTGQLALPEKPARKGRAVAPKAPKMTVEQGSDLVNELHERAVAEDATYEELDDRLKAVDALSAADIKTVARGFGVAPGKTKKDGIEAIREKIRRRRGTLVRNQF